MLLNVRLRVVVYVRKGKPCVFTSHDGSRGKTGKQTTIHPFFGYVEEERVFVDGLLNMIFVCSMID